ncbi:MAG: type II secretion system protein [Planctomycetota bacterium]
MSHDASAVPPAGRAARSAGFTLIELMIVMAILGVLAAVLLQSTGGVRLAAHQFADLAQLRTHETWLELYESKHQRALPQESGHRLILSTWTSGVMTKTEENLDYFFSPGARDNDPAYRAAREQIEVGQDPWPSLARVDSLQTDYAGRARRHLRNARHARQALMATDNELGHVWSDGTVHVLFGDGRTRAYSYQDLQARFGLPDFDPDVPVATTGAESPIPECRQLVF